MAQRFYSKAVKKFESCPIEVEDRAVTQDTTGPSINTFDPVEVIYQNPCNVYIGQFYMKHGVENCVYLEEAIQEIHDIVVILRRA